MIPKEKRYPRCLGKRHPAKVRKDEMISLMVKLEDTAIQQQIDLEDSRRVRDATVKERDRLFSTILALDSSLKGFRGLAPLLGDTPKEKAIKSAFCHLEDLVEHAKPPEHSVRTIENALRAMNPNADIASL
jgi:hypothetical protein